MVISESLIGIHFLIFEFPGRTNFSDSRVVCQVTFIQTQ